MEEVGLVLMFQEVRTRGDDKYLCVLRAVEEGIDDRTAEETIAHESWEAFKEEYPTLKDILVSLFPSNSWNPSWRDGERILFIESITGHEGLYEFDENNRIEVDWDSEMR